MMQNEQLPEVELYGIGADEADYAAPLLTAEAVTYIKNNEAIGMALAEENEVRAAVCARFHPENENVFEIISLYVAPSARHRGLGGTLLMELLERVMAVTDGSVEYVTTEFSSDQEELERLLVKVGFGVTSDEEGKLWTVTLDELADSPLLERGMKVPKDCMLATLANVSDIDIRRLTGILRENGVEDLDAAQMREAMQDVSYVLLDGKQEPKACAVLSAQDETQLWLSQFFAEKGSPAYGVTALQAAANAVLEHYPKEQRANVTLEIPTLTASSAGLVEKLLAPKTSFEMRQAVLDMRAF